MLKINILIAIMLLQLFQLPKAISKEFLYLPLLDGGRIAVDGKLDKPLYLKFWASWCETCRKQMPHLESIHKNYKDKLDVVAVNFGFNDSLKLVKQFQKDFKLTVPISYDPLGLAAKHFEVPVVPYNILINREGKIFYKGYNLDDVDNKITKLLEDK